MSRVRRLACSSLAVVLLTLGALNEPAQAQDQVRLGPYVIDIRGALPRFGQNAILAAQRGLDTLQLPAWGLGLDVGAHVYPLRWRAITFGVGVQALFSRGERAPTLAEIEQVGGTTAEDALAPRADVDLHLVDEIGKMECLSPRFVTAMRALLDAGMPVVATIALRGGGFIAEVKSRDDVEIREVRPANREALVEEVVAWIRRASGSSRLENAP